MAWPTRAGQSLEEDDGVVLIDVCVPIQAARLTLDADGCARMTETSLEQPEVFLIHIAITIHVAEHG